MACASRIGPRRSGTAYTPGGLRPFGPPATVSSHTPRIFGPPGRREGAPRHICVPSVRSSAQTARPRKPSTYDPPHAAGSNSGDGPCRPDVRAGHRRRPGPRPDHDAHAHLERSRVPVHPLHADDVRARPPRPALRHGPRLPDHGRDPDEGQPHQPGRGARGVRGPLPRRRCDRPRAARPAARLLEVLLPTVVLPRQQRRRRDRRHDARRDGKTEASTPSASTSSGCRQAA